MLRGASGAGIAAFAWLLVALVVAIPVEFLTLDWKKASERFVLDFHVIFIFFLIFVDVFIASKLLYDTEIEVRLRKNGPKILFVTICSGILWALVARVSPEVFWASLHLVFITALFVLLLVRYWTYHVSIKATPLGTPTFDSRSQP